MVKTPLTGVDSSTSWIVNFTQTLQAQAVLTCSMTVPTAQFGVTIRYRNGNIIIGTPIFKPSHFIVQYFDKPGSGVVVREEKRVFHYVGGGWHYEADEVARCIRDGKIESDTWGHDKSLLLMDTFDEVSTMTALDEQSGSHEPFRFVVKGDTHCPMASRKSYERTMHEK